MVIADTFFSVPLLVYEALLPFDSMFFKLMNTIIIQKREGGSAKHLRAFGILKFRAYLHFCVFGKPLVGVLNELKVEENA